MPDKPYSVITISFACVLLYVITVLLTRFKILPQGFQRKLWNVLLLIAIGVAGTIGVFLAVAINLKWDIALPDMLLRWHVNFGIALFLIAIIHFSFHIKYYWNLFSVKRSEDATPVAVSRNYSQSSVISSKLIVMLSFAMGFTAMASQLVLLRDFISVFNGNELVIGIVLAIWMLLTGLGAILGKSGKQISDLNRISKLLALLSVLPAISLILLDFTRNIVLPVGGIPGPFYMIMASVLLLSPFCLVSGWLFTIISALAKSGSGNPVSLVYAIETTGSIVAGALFGLVLFFFLQPFQNLALMMVIDAVLLSVVQGKNAGKNWLIPVVAVVFGIAVLVFNFDLLSQKFLFPAQRILLLKETPYGKLVVTGHEGQLNFYDNNNLLSTSNNTIESEEAVHYNLLQRKITGNVLLIGGGISGAASECLKYTVGRLDYAELNKWIVELGREFRMIPADPRLNILTGDPKLQIMKMAADKLKHFEYQSVIINTPGPSTLQANRFYSVEFFGMLKKLLVSDGVVSLSLTPTADYVGNDSQPLQSSVYNTLKQVFRNVTVITGEKNYFLASDGPLTTEVASLAASRGIETRYVNSYYLDNASLRERSEAVARRISVEAPLNHDFRPVDCYLHMRYWMSYTGRYTLLLLIVPILLLMLAGAARSKNAPVALFTAGFVSFSLELILILAFQALYGYVYLYTGIFITLFMCGLLGGVLSARKIFINPKHKYMIIIQLFMFILIIITLCLLTVLKVTGWPDELIQIVFSLIIVLAAWLTGMQFHVASCLRNQNVQKTAASAYSADVLGSAAGSVLINVWLVPVYGFTAALLATGSVCAISLLLLIFRKRSGH